MTPEGDVLAAHHKVHDEKNWTNEVLFALNDGVRRMRPLPPRQPEPRELLPFRGKGVQEDGSVSLALHVRSLTQGRPSLHHGVYDTVDLTAAQWKEFAPPDSAVGTSWRLPKEVFSQFSRGLSSISDQATMPRPGDVFQGELVGKVVDVRRGALVITYDGQIAAVHLHPFVQGKSNGGKAQLQGIGTYDLEARELRYLLLLGTGASRELQPTLGESVPLGFAVEWQRRAGR